MEKIAEIHDVFNMFDSDKSGDIDISELKAAFALLDPEMVEEEVEELMAELDADGNGTIEFEEFLQMMTKKEEKKAVDTSIPAWASTSCNAVCEGFEIPLKHHLGFHRGRLLGFTDDRKAVYVSGNLIKVVNMVDEWEISILGQGMGIGAAAVCPKCPVIAWCELKSNPVISCVDIEAEGNDKKLQVVEISDIAQLEIKAMSFSWDGKLLAVLTGETENQLVLIEWRNGAEKRIKRRIDLNKPFTHVSFCPTDNDQICVSGKGRCRIHRFEGVRDVMVSSKDVAVKNVDQDVAMDFGPHCWTTSGHLFVGTDSGDVLRVDPASGDRVQSLKVIHCHSKIVELVLEESHVITASEDGHVRLFTRTNHELVADIDLGETAVVAAKFEDSYQKLFVETAHGSLFRVEFPGAMMENGEYYSVKRLAADHEGAISCLDTFKSGEPWVASTGQDGTMRVWDYRRKGSLGGLRGESPLTAVTCHPSKPMVAVGSQQGMLRFARCSNVGCDISVRQKLFEADVVALKFNHNGDYLVCCSGAGHVFFADGQVDTTLQLLTYTKFDKRIVSVAWLLQELYVAFEDRSVHCITAPSLSMKNEELPAPTEPWVLTDQPITAIGAGGSLVMVLTADASLTCYNMSGEVVQRFVDHQKQPDSLEVSPDGRLMATGGRDGRIYVRSTDFSKVQHIQAHNYLADGVGVLKFSTSSEQLFSAGAKDGMFAMWNLNNTNHMTRQRESELAVLDDSEIDVSVEVVVLDDIAAKVREAEEALHAEERSNLRSKVAALKAKLDNLIQSNETAPDLEKMDRKELVIDFETRDQLMAENQKRVDEVKEDTRYKNLGYDLIASRIKKEAWLAMEVQGKTIMPFKNADGHAYNVSSFPLRKRTRAEKSKLANVRMLRCVERAEMWQRSKKDSKGDGGDKGGEEGGEDGEAAQEEEFFDENKVGQESNFQLLYDWFETFTPQRKRAQIVILEAVVHDTQKKFNEQCEKMLGEKEGVIAFVKKNNDRIKQVMFELDIEEEIFEPVLSEFENPDMCLTCADDEVKVEKFKSKAQMAAEAQAAKEEEERLAAMEDNIFERALEDFMHGTLEVKKEEINLREEFPKQEWMTTTAPEDMSDDQKKEFAEWQVAKAKFEEEADKYRRALEAELKKLHGDNAEACTGFDEKLTELYQQMLLTQRRIYEYELRMISLASSLQQEAARDAKISSMEAEFTEVARRHEETSYTRKEFQIELEKRTDEYQALVTEERGMEKQFKKEITEVAEPDQVNVLMGLYKKRNRPVRRASVVALRNASLRVMQQFKPNNGRRKRRNSLADMLDAGEDPEEDFTPSFHEGTASPYGGVLDLLLKKRKRPLMKLGEHRLPLHEYPEGISDIVIEKLDRSRDAKIEAELSLAVMSDEIKDMNLRFDKMSKEDDDVAAQKHAIQSSLDALYAEQKRSRFNMDVLFSLKQGQVEVEQAAVVTDFSDSIMIHRSVVDEVNAHIRKLWAEKLEILSESKSVRGEFAKQRWEQERLDMTFDDLTERTREFQLQRVTKSLQELIKSGVGVDARKEAEITTLERKIEFYQSSFEAKVKERKGKLQKLRQVTKELQEENWQLEEDIRELEISVSERKKIYDLKFEHQDAGAGKEGRGKFNEAVARKRLVDIAKAQAEEVEFLREELTRLRQRTFPSFSHLAK